MLLNSLASNLLLLVFSLVNIENMLSLSCSPPQCNCANNTFYRFQPKYVVHWSVIVQHACHLWFISFHPILAIYHPSSMWVTWKSTHHHANSNLIFKYVSYYLIMYEIPTYPCMNPHLSKHLHVLYFINKVFIFCHKADKVAIEYINITMLRTCFMDDLEVKIL